MQEERGTGGAEDRRAVEIASQTKERGEKLAFLYSQLLSETHDQTEEEEHADGEHWCQTFIFGGDSYCTSF